MSLETIDLQIKDLGEVITGGTPPTKKREFYGDLVPLIKPTDMVLGQRYIGDTEESLSDIGVERFKKKLVPKNTPCVVTIGTIGKSCLTKELSLVNQAVNCVVVDESRFDYMYIYYLMQATIYKVKALDSGTASGRENVSKSVFESIHVRVVKSKSKQKELGQILSNYDSLIENNNRRIAILEDMAQSLYREWFVKFRFPGHENVKFKDSPLGQIPEGWEVKPLIDVLNTIIDYRGKTPKKLGGDWVTNGIKALSALNVKNGGLIRLDACKQVDPEIYNKWMKVKLDENDILLTSEAPLGEVALLKGDSEFCLSQRLFALRVNQDYVTPEYIFLALFSGHLVGQLLSRATGATVAGIRQALLKEVPIVVPSKKIMNEFTETAISLLQQKSVLWNKNNNLQQQRDMLLPKLISGKIKLKD